MEEIKDSEEVAKTETESKNSENEEDKSGIGSQVTCLLMSACKLPSIQSNCAACFCLLRDGLAYADSVAV